MRNMQLNIAMGTSDYPDSLEDAMNIRNTHQQSKRYSNKHTYDVNQKTEMNVGQKIKN